MAGKKKSTVNTEIEWGVLNPRQDNLVADNFEENDVQWLSYLTNKFVDSINSDDDYVKKGIIERIESDPEQLLPTGVYRCKVRWVEGDGISTVESMSSEVETTSHSLNNLRRTYEGRLSKKPQIGQECTIKVPKTNLRHIDGEILELHNRFWYTTAGASRQRSKKESAKNSTKAGGVAGNNGISVSTNEDTQTAEGSS
jgi:hypothetical protein